MYSEDRFRVSAFATANNGNHSKVFALRQQEDQRPKIISWVKMLKLKLTVYEQVVDIICVSTSKDESDKNLINSRAVQIRTRSPNQPVHYRRY